MEAIHLMLADSANISREGKLNVLGIFNRITSSSFPTIHPQMYIIAELIASPAEYDIERELRIRILDSDAQTEIFNWSRKIKVPKPTQGSVGGFKQILSLSQLLFPKPDTYQVSLLIDNDEKATTRLYLEQSPPLKP